MPLDSEILTNVSIDELEALAAGVLVPAAQSRLEDLIASSKKGPLVASDERELGELLHRVDQLNLLKARALYTIHQLGAKVSSP